MRVFFPITPDSRDMCRKKVPMTRRVKAGLVCCAVVCGMSPAAQASSLVFRGQNVALFPYANPSGLSAMMNSVKKRTQASSVSASLSTSALIQHALASQISSRIYQDIFQGTNLSGFYDLGDGNSISYVRGGGYITIEIVSPDNGSTTITLPDV